MSARGRASELRPVLARRWASLLCAAIVLAGWAEPTWACSVCVGAETPDTRNAWIAMTAFMTFTPIGIVLSVIFWLRQRFRALEASEREAEQIGRRGRDESAMGSLPS